MRYVRNYILYLVIVCVTGIIGCRLIFYFLMVESYRPEWFILFTGVVFIGAGIWVAREWYKLQKRRQAIFGPGFNSQLIKDRFGLSKSETEVLEMLANGQSNSQIANTRHVSINTIKTHISNIYSKLGVKNRLQALYKIHENQPPG
ncbi:MAG: helix-turn-helix transcriptional regulator [Bacteroidetes bacterium]|nr:helix-turn-helix transcriptional regulator [Bacteroidota bacterium]